LGIGIYSGDFYLSDKPASKLAKNIEPSITATNQEPGQDAPAHGTIGHQNTTNTNQGTSQGTIDNSRLAQQPAALSVATGTRANNRSPVTNHDEQLFTTPLTDNNNRSGNETSILINNFPQGLDISRNASESKLAERTVAANVKMPGVKEPSVQLKQSSAIDFADAASESVLDENKKQGVNWLQDYAVFQLTAAKAKRVGVQIYFSPTVNYRKLSGSSNFPSSELKHIPLSPNIMGDVDQYVKHKPALGFEIGANMLYRSTKRLTFKAGLQFNYSRYNIQAYESLPEVATIALSNNFAFQADTISTLSNIRNLSGYEQEQLSNQYFQISAPIGLEFRLIGNDNLQLNVAGTLQPTYLLNANSYLITTDYKNYMREPSLVRRWNLNGGLEAYISYNTGTVRWQVGPQFRYQFLSSYSRKYPIKEQLMEYGIKIGVSKLIQ